jgi:hypothetical protein
MKKRIKIQIIKELITLKTAILTYKTKTIKKTIVQTSQQKIKLPITRILFKTKTKIHQIIKSQ